MAFDAFLKIEGIPGESTDKRHPGEIEVLSFSWGVSNSATSGGGGGGGAGKAALKEFVIVKLMDTASPLLFESCCKGEHIRTADFTLVDRSSGLAFYKIHFDDVLVSSLQPASAPGGGAALESLSFNVEKLTITAQDTKGNTTSIECFAHGAVAH